MICQSCGMEIKNDGLMGTYPDGRKNTEYCIHCYRDGFFTHDLDMNGQIELCLNDLDAWNREHDTALSKDEAERMMEDYFSHLKRWLSMEDKASWILDHVGYVFFSTVSSSGYPRSVAMDVVKHDGVRELWMTTYYGSEKVRHIRENPKAGISFVHEADSVSLTGRVEIIRDENTLKDFWMPVFSYYFNSPENPNYCLLRFRAEEAVLWIDGQSAHINLMDE